MKLGILVVGLIAISISENTKADFYNAEEVYIMNVAQGANSGLFLSYGARGDLDTTTSPSIDEAYRYVRWFNANGFDCNPMEVRNSAGNIVSSGTNCLKRQPAANSRNEVMTFTSKDFSDGITGYQGQLRHLAANGFTCTQGGSGDQMQATCSKPVAAETEW